MYILDQYKECGFKINDNHVFRVEEPDGWYDGWTVTVTEALIYDSKNVRVLGRYENETRAKEVLCDLLVDLAAGDVPIARMPEE